MIFLRQGILKKLLIFPNEPTENYKIFRTGGIF